MTATDERPHQIDDDVWTRLNAPFPLDQIEKLPRALRAGDQDKGRCERGGHYSADNFYCGGWHPKSIHLDYVGHAGITTRLNEVVGPPNWTWEPMYRDVSDQMADLIKAALTAGDQALARVLFESCPAKYTDGGLWIRLTILGASKPGFGDAQGKSGPNAIKELIGDAIRNASLRFGIATYLWSKSESAQILKAGGDPDANDPSPARAVRNQGPDIEARQQARSAARAIQRQKVPAQQAPQGDQHTTNPESLAMAQAATVQGDHTRLLSLYAEAKRKGWLGHHVHDVISEPEAGVVGITATPVTLDAWLKACGHYAKTNGGMSVRDAVNADPSNHTANA